MKSIIIGHIKTKHKNINLYARCYKIGRKEFVVIYYFPRCTKNTPAKEKNIKVKQYKHYLSNCTGILLDVGFNDYTLYLRKIYKKYGKNHNYSAKYIKKGCFIYPANKIDKILKNIKEQSNVYIKIDSYKKMKLCQMAMEV